MFESSSLGILDLIERSDIADIRQRSSSSPYERLADNPRLTLVSDVTANAVLPRHALNIKGIAAGERGDQHMLVSRRASRLFDAIIASAALIVFGPLMLLIAAAIRLSSNGPVFFSQVRLGEGGRQFRCLKFRTMRIDAEEILAALLADPAARAEWDRDYKMRNDPRVTPIGRFLRKTSFDELPQIFNVLVGDMSIVGPRPIVAAEVGRYGGYIRAYYSVRPGITGLWQVSGRNHTSYRRRVACDVTYARSRSATGDLAIIARTIPAVLMARGAY